MPFDLQRFVEAAGYAGVFAMVFAETGLLIGFMLPGDSLLLTAGLLAARGHFSLALLLPLLIVASISGYATGYAIGRHAVSRLFVREDARFFPRRHLLRAREFYDRHGGKTIVIARFLPFIRTFVPPIAGAVGMPYLRFTAFNVVGGVGWVCSMTLLGYWLGERIPPALDLLVLAAVVAVSLLDDVVDE